MGNHLFNRIENKSLDFLSHIDEENIYYLRNNYKILDVDYLDPILVRSKMLEDEYFKLYPIKKKIVNELMDYYINHKSIDIYKKKTDYFCNDKEKICICNLYANEFRKISKKKNQNPDGKYISWLKK